jgi:glycosyltransferase involved in cell wall biosynthesis
LRIGVIAHLKYPVREPFAGGLEMHSHLLATKLRDRGHQVTIFASTRSDPGLGLEAICDETALTNVGVAEANDVAFFKEHHAYLQLMTSLRNRPFDVIHNNSLHYLPVAMADTLPMPMVTTLHTPPFCWLESGIRVCRAPRARFVAVSRSVRSTWSRITHVNEVILNGIDLRRFAYRATPDPEPYLVWYGRIVPEKGLDLAMDAARRMGMPLRIAGPALDTAYFDRDIRPRLGRDAVYMGHLTHPDLSRLVGGARAFLCTPRWEEPYGLVVAEALACGVPVAAFARGAIPEILDETCGVLAKPDDAEDLSRAALKALTLDRHHCRVRAENHCDCETMISRYEDLYADVATVRAAPPRRRARPAVVRPLLEAAAL